jgi:hypothetical protein
MDLASGPGERNMVVGCGLIGVELLGMVGGVVSWNPGSAGRLPAFLHHNSQHCFVAAPTVVLGLNGDAGLRCDVSWASVFTINPQGKGRSAANRYVPLS